MSAAALALALLAAHVPPEREVNLCFVQRVDAHGAGISIAFHTTHQAHVVGAAGGEARIVAIGPGQPPLSLRPGESASIPGWHDGCNLNIAFRAGRAGLLVRTWAWTDPSEGTMQSFWRFIPAEPRR